MRIQAPTTPTIINKVHFLFALLATVLIITLMYIFHYIDHKRTIELERVRYTNSLKEKYFHQTIRSENITKEEAWVFVKRLQKALNQNDRMTIDEKKQYKHSQLKFRQTHPEYLWPLARQSTSEELISTLKDKSGIKIPAIPGAPVVAIDKGNVLFSDSSIRGYGHLIVIQHDNELISVYGNNHINYVDEGDSVSKGQIIGLVGEHNEKPGLYFEVRHKGIAQPPLSYIIPHTQTY